MKKVKKGSILKVIAEKTVSSLTISAMVFMYTGALVPLTAYAADTGFKSPTASVANNPGDGNPDQWTNPGDAYSDSGGAASDNEGDKHRYYNFDFNVPANSIIDGIEASADAWSSDPTYCQIGIDLSWNGGSNWSSEKLKNLSDSEMTYTLGDGTNKWGSHSWVDSDFSNSNFRARVRDVDSGNDCDNNATIYLDWLRLKVFYHAPIFYTIMSAAGTGGAISPLGAVSVAQGASQSFAVSPDDGHVVYDVFIDDVSSGRINSRYFTDVQSDHSISASFDGGWKAPSFFADNNGVGEPQKAYSSDDQRAVFNNSNDRIDYTDFNLSIPPDAVINGIEVAVEGNRTSGRTLDISLSWDDGDHFTPVKNLGGFTSSDATFIAGSSADTWGRTWSTGDFTNFRIQTDTTSGGGDLNLDQLQVKVYYTEPVLGCMDSNASNYNQEAVVDDGSCEYPLSPPPPPPPPVDICSNIDGVQESVPEGLVLIGDECVAIGNGPPGDFGGFSFGSLGGGSVLGAVTTVEEQIALLKEQIAALQNQLLGVLNQLLAQLQAQLDALLARQQ